MHNTLCAVGDMCEVE